MKPDELERILSRETEIVPSSRFANSVMAAVRREATAPPPIPFPWGLASPGLAACGIAIAWLFIEAFRAPAQESASAVTSTMLHWIGGAASMLAKAENYGAVWVLVALLLTLACLKLTRHLAGGWL